MPESSREDIKKLPVIKFWRAIKTKRNDGHQPGTGRLVDLKENFNCDRGNRFSVCGLENNTTLSGYVTHASYLHVYDVYENVERTYLRMYVGTLSWNVWKAACVRPNFRLCSWKLWLSYLRIPVGYGFFEKSWRHSILQSSKPTISHALSKLILQITNVLELLLCLWYTSKAFDNFVLLLFHFICENINRIMPTKHLYLLTPPCT